MQRSFSIIHDDETSNINNPDENEIYSNSSGSHSDDLTNNKLKRIQKRQPMKLDALPKKEEISISNKQFQHEQKSKNSSDESDESEIDNKPKKFPGQYDPKEYDDLEVDPEINELFQYITKYTPQYIKMEYKYKPFISDYIPAVGDVDAFLKIIPPETLPTGNHFNPDSRQLGLNVLDEPATNESDPALLHLQLRAAANETEEGVKQNDIVVKTIDNTEKNGHVIDRWIKDITNLHKSKASLVVQYTQAMPELEDLMQQWPEDMEKRLKEEGFPKPKDDQTLSEYIDVVCNYFQIPIAENKIQSLHLLFNLYIAVRQSKLYQKEDINSTQEMNISIEKKDVADQLVLD